MGTGRGRLSGAGRDRAGRQEHGSSAGPLAAGAACPWMAPSTPHQHTQPATLAKDAPFLLSCPSSPRQGAGGDAERSPETVRSAPAGPGKRGGRGRAGGEVAGVVAEPEALRVTSLAGGGTGSPAEEREAASRGQHPVLLTAGAVLGSLPLA